ncbi:MAG: helix-turn-helix transcriptional regulator [Candidatus Promineofilum sp.]|nr:helix-turn-helix transcriptional regulator [Promineifilum sp.]
MSDTEREREHSGSNAKPEWADWEFHDRLRYLLTKEKSTSAFARKAGLSQSGLHRIEVGGEPTLKTLLAIARAAGVSIQWLASGEGPMRPTTGAAVQQAAPAEPAIDKWLFSRVIDGIRRVYKRVGGQLPTVNEVELALDMHNRIAALAEGQEARHGALLMALDQLERDLHSSTDTAHNAQTDDDKRSA